MESDRRPLLKLHINVIIGFWSFIAYVVIFVLSFIRPELFGQILPLITSSWSQVGGIIAVGFETTSVLQNFGFGKFLFYWGFISVNLAIFNLLPFPGLDGWQLLVLIVEGITRKKIPEKVKNIVSFIGIGLLLVLMGVVVVKDVIKYIFAGAIRLL